MVKKRIIESVCWSLWPLPLAVLDYVFAPNVSLWFVHPLLWYFGSPYGRLVLLGGTIWLLLGFFVMYKCSRWWQRPIATLIFPVPLIYLSMLGPAVPTIIDFLRSILPIK